MVQGIMFDSPAYLTRYFTFPNCTF